MIKNNVNVCDEILKELCCSVACFIRSTTNVNFYSGCINEDLSILNALGFLDGKTMDLFSFFDLGEEGVMDYVYNLVKKLCSSEFDCDIYLAWYRKNKVKGMKKNVYNTKM